MRQYKCLNQEPERKGRPLHIDVESRFDDSFIELELGRRKTFKKPLTCKTG